MTTGPDAPSLRHDPGRHRYEVLADGEVVGAADYLDHPGPGSPERIFFHTEVDDAHAGQGLAARLAGFALDDAVRAGLTVVPVCPYIKAYLRRHPQYQPHSTGVTAEHLALLRSR